MDNKEKNIQKEVEKTMQSLDNRSRLKANPWLFTRIEAQLKNADQSDPVWSFSQLLQPVMLSCLLLLNVYTGYTVFSNSSITDDNNTNTIADEYSYMADQSLEYYIPE